MAEVKACGDLMKVTEVGTLHGFRAAFDVEMDLGQNVKVTATPTKDPTIFCYVDKQHILPVRDRVSMKQSDIKSNLCFQADKTNCTLKLWETKNSSFVNSEGKVSNDSSDYYMWQEDFELVNQEEFRELPLSAKFSHKEKINMPWMLTSNNILPHANQGDKIGPWDFPSVEKGKIEEKEIMWVTRSFGGAGRAAQAHAVNFEPWGQELPDMLLRGYPLTTEVDVEVPYTIWFWADYEATVITRKCKWIYGHKSTNPRKHFGGFPTFGTGQKVSWDVKTTTNYEKVPKGAAMSKVA